jgi:predicted Zn-dependent protease
VARSLGVSAGAVAAAVGRARARRLTWAAIEALTDEALERQLAATNAPSSEDFFRLAYACEISGAKEKRREALENGLRKFPEDNALRLQLAFLLASKKEYKEALAVLNRHPNLRTDLTALHLYLNVIAETHDYAKAEKFLKSGVDKKKLEDTSIRELLASIYEGNKNYPAAEKIYRRLFEQDSSDSMRGLNYARVLMKVGKPQKAELVLRPLIHHPNPDVLKEAAQLYGEMGKYAEAEGDQPEKWQDDRRDLAHGRPDFRMTTSGGPGPDRPGCAGAIGFGDSGQSSGPGYVSRRLGSFDLSGTKWPIAPLTMRMLLRVRMTLPSPPPGDPDAD